MSFNRRNFLRRGQAFFKRWKTMIFVATLTFTCAVSLCTRADEAKPEEEWKAPDRAARRKNPIPADEKSIAAGKQVYLKQCLSCHGPLGKGDGQAAKDLNPKPHDLSDPKIAAQSDGALFWKITNGRKPMPTFEKLIPKEEDRWKVVNYVRTLEPAPSTASSGG